jgi:hypothetical protein
MKNFFLSAHTLNLYRECPRCFWRHIRKGQDYRRPEPPTSTLPRGMDTVIKSYFDGYRAQGLVPPELAAVSGGRLVEDTLIQNWRSWKTGLQFIRDDGHRLIGALDECAVEGGTYIPVDYKTRGFDVKADSASYYVFQMSCYNFLLSRNGYPTQSYAYLIFFIPSRVNEAGDFEFKRQAQKVVTLPCEEVEAEFKSALSILSRQEAPGEGKSCKFCAWAKRCNLGAAAQLHLFE